MSLSKDQIVHDLALAFATQTVRSREIPQDKRVERFGEFLHEYAYMLNYADTDLEKAIKDEKQNAEERRRG